MKKAVIVISVISILLIISFCIFYFLFKVSTGFVSGIDGNKGFQYEKLVKEYYFLNNTRTISLKIAEGVYEKVVKNYIDSLSWNDDVIIGFGESKYFKIDITTRQINYFTSKDSLVESLSVLPTNTLTEIPSIEIVTKKIEIKKKKLYINEQLVHAFEYEIDKYKIIDDHIIVLLNIPEDVIYNENIFCFDTKGKFLWQVEKQNEHNKKCPFTGIAYKAGQFTPYKSCGILTLVDLLSGKILSSELVK